MLRWIGLLLLTPVIFAVPVPDEPARNPTIDKALAFLATLQQPDGSFQGRGTSPPIAMTGLAILAHLSAGIKPDDKVHGPTLKRAVASLLAAQDQQGLFKEPRSSTTFYNHGIATWALAEYTLAAGKETQQQLSPVLKRAVQLTIKTQSQSGGWRYSIAPVDGDLSVTSWQILALRAASRAGIDVPAPTLKAAMKFVASCRHKEPGRGFCYVPNSGNPTAGCTAAGTLHLLLDGAAPGSEEITALRDTILKQDAQPPIGYYLYTRNNQCQALARIGGKEAEAHLKTIEDALRKLQNEQGAFESRQSPSEQTYGPVYLNSLAILALTARDSRLAATRPQRP